jgi:hypothetical protein
MRLAPKVLVIAAIIVAILLVAGFNIWVFRYAKEGKAPSVFQGTFSGVQTTPPVVPFFSPTPTPRPTGPGDYACDPYGVCNKYSEEARKQFCTVTFADSLCLDQCGDKTKQCQQ